ncbi:class I SAM-dependent methyltransferase [Chryseolinea sp. T2]|uniref:class I SAM-dependent methyltransferase n=1 Tax=Chryseolinea sp. T2 TaxID=3129255 RepID=UPI0030770251
MSQNDESYKKQWDQRYSDEAFAYGKAPNEFFRDQLKGLEPGSILMPADGEGRNGVYAATLGWEVTAVDLSVEGRSKALRLADEMDVEIEYLVGDLERLGFQEKSFDAIGLIYAHFLANKKSSIHRKLSTFLKPGGIIIFEAFSKAHLEYVKANPKVGGPRDIEMLFSTEELAADFSGYDIIMLEELEVLNEEGRYHSGASSVVRFVGKKRIKN